MMPNNPVERQDHRLFDDPIAAQGVVDQKPMHAPVAIGQRVDIDKTKSQHGTAQQRRLALGALPKGAEPVEHGPYLVCRRGHVVHQLLVTVHRTHKHRRLADAAALQRGALAQNLGLQLRQRGLVEWQGPLSGAPRQHIGKALDAIGLIGLALDGKAQPSAPVRLHRPARTSARAVPGARPRA